MRDCYRATGIVRLKAVRGPGRELERLNHPRCEGARARLRSRRCKVARKRKRLALKSKRRAGPAHIRWRVVVDCVGVTQRRQRGARGRLCRCKPAACPCRSFPAHPGEGPSGRRGGLTTPHETLRLGVRRDSNSRFVFSQSASLARDLLPEQPGGPPSREGVPLNSRPGPRV
jgi:hypothetical protein